MPCLCIFIAFLAAFGYVTYSAYHEGQVGRLIAPLDADKNFCGEGSFSEYQYLYLTELDSIDITGIFDSGVCVKSCPKT